MVLTESVAGPSGATDNLLSGAEAVSFREPFELFSSFSWVLPFDSVPAVHTWLCRIWLGGGGH